MFFFKGLHFFVLIVLALGSSKETVNVTLHYESLCPYSLEFINKQLYPAYKILGDAISLNLVPFGNAEVKHGRQNKAITCQHGPKECYGNKMHACAIENNTQNVWMHFIGCSMASSKPYDKRVAEVCAQKHNLPWMKLRACAESVDADDLLSKYGEVFEKHKIGYVPSILFNGKYSEEHDEKARLNFLAVVCELFSENLSICSNIETVKL